MPPSNVIPIRSLSDARLLTGDLSEKRRALILEMLEDLQVIATEHPDSLVAIASYVRRSAAPIRRRLDAQVQQRA